MCVCVCVCVCVCLCVCVCVTYIIIYYIIYYVTLLVFEGCQKGTKDDETKILSHLPLIGMKRHTHCYNKNTITLTFGC